MAAAVMGGGDAMELLEVLGGGQDSAGERSKSTSESTKASYVRNVDYVWPFFKPINYESSIGNREMSPLKTLMEFISTSASCHGVKTQDLKSLELDLLKVLPYNVMPANAAAWYMAKRKFYADQPVEQQLLSYLLKKFPDMFKVSRFKVEFLESYNKEVAKRKLNYMVQFGIYAYFQHKIEDYGVYFFDPNYYERTEPFHESLRISTGSNWRASAGRLTAAYFKKYRDQIQYLSHGTNLVSVCKKPGVKVITNKTGVIVSLMKSQYGGWTDHGYIKFGTGETAIFCSKSLFKDGRPFTGDPNHLPHMLFDAFQMPANSYDDSAPKWYAVLVWCGIKPSTKHYSTLADLNATSTFKAGMSELDMSVEGRKLRQPTGSMMIGQVLHIRKNGATVTVRGDSHDKVFIPGWSKEDKYKNRSGFHLTTGNGEVLNRGDLVAYYMDSEISIPGYALVGRNAMVLKDHQDVYEDNVFVPKKRRNRMSVTLSAGAEYLHSEEEVSSGESGAEVSDSELEWLENDLTDLMESQGSSARTHSLFEGVKSALEYAREQVARHSKDKRSPRSGRDSGVESKETSPNVDKGNFSPQTEAFWRTKNALANLGDYRSSEDEDYKSGDEVENLEIPRMASTNRRRRRQSSTKANSGRATFGGRRNQRNNSEANSDTPRGRGRRWRNDSIRSQVTMNESSCVSDVSYQTDRPSRKVYTLPYWVRAISLPEDFDAESGNFVAIDRWYREDRDPDYYLPQVPAYDYDTDDEKEDSAKEEASEDQKDGEEGEEAEPKETVDKNAELEEELQLLTKEANEAIPEELLRGDHKLGQDQSKLAPKVVLTPSKDGDDGTASTADNQDIVIVDEDKSDSQQAAVKYRTVPECFLHDWASNVLNPEGELDPSDCDSDEDPEYVPPTIFYENELDFGEFVNELEDDTIDPSEVADITAELEEIKVKKPCRSCKYGEAVNYIAIHVPIPTIASKKEAALKAKEEDEAAKAAALEQTEWDNPDAESSNIEDQDVSQVVTRGKINGTSPSVPSSATAESGSPKPSRAESGSPKKSRAESGSPKKNSTESGSPKKSSAGSGSPKLKTSPKKRTSESN